MIKTRDGKQSSSFDCDRAQDPSWDEFRSTQAYSPRNEAYRHAVRFVNMWSKLMGSVQSPYRK